MKKTIVSILKVTIILAIPIAALNVYFMYQRFTNSPTVAKQNSIQKDTSVTGQQVTNTVVFPAKEIIGAYLQVKNALAKDDGKEAAAAGDAIVAILAKVNIRSLTPQQAKSYVDIADDLKENAEHIGVNAGKIDHQREHFEMMSKDIADLVTIFGNGGQILFKDFCPKAHDGKGALWVSETQDISNPYLGKAMPTCGTMKEEMKQP